MGWRSVYVRADTDEEKLMFLNIIKQHNTEPNFDLVGEELEALLYAVRKRDKKSFLFFGSGGGMGHTERYFKLHLPRVRLNEFHETDLFKFTLDEKCLNLDEEIQRLTALRK